MVSFGLSPKKSKFSLEKLDSEKLRKENATLDIDTNLLYREIGKLGEQQKKLFNEGVGADRMKKEMLALKLKELEMTRQMKYREYKFKMSEKIVVSNLLILKKYQDQIQNSKIGSVLNNYDPDQLKKLLAEVTVRGESAQAAVDDLTKILDASNEGVLGENGTEDPVMAAWDSIEQGKLTPEAAEAELYSIDNEFEPKVKLT